MLADRMRQATAGGGLLSSGEIGDATVLTTAGARDQHMVWIPAFDVSAIHPDLGNGLHPAFIINGEPIDGFYIGQYTGVAQGGELISQPGTSPYSQGLDFDEFSTAARACGAGWHMVTAAEWAAVVLVAEREGYIEAGNDNSNEPDTVLGATGTADPAASGPVLTGTGPDGWRVPNIADGIADLVGNYWEWVAGLRRMDSEIEYIADNDAATVDLAAASAAWQVLGAGYDWPSSTQDFDAAAWSPQPTGADLQIAQRLALLPIAGMASDRGSIYGTTTTGERLVVRGGGWDGGAGAGWFAAIGGSARSSPGPNFAARPAFVAF